MKRLSPKEWFGIAGLVLLTGFAGYGLYATLRPTPPVMTAAEQARIEREDRTRATVALGVATAVSSVQAWRARQREKKAGE